jgi:nucleoid DNA-binding protein
VEALVGTITEVLTQGDEVRISGFGSFGISERSERQGRNTSPAQESVISAFTLSAMMASTTSRSIQPSGLKSMRTR